MKLNRLLSFIIIFSSILSLGVFVNAEGEYKGEIVFSETFEGDLSRWSFDSNKYASIAQIKKEERSSYINNHILLGNKSDDGVKSELFKVNANTIYTVAVDSKGEGSRKYKIVFYDENNEIILTKNNAALIKETGGWICDYFSIVSPEKSVAASIVLESYASEVAKIYFDNIVVCTGVVAFNRKLAKRSQNPVQATDDSSIIFKRENVLFLETFENDITEWNYLNDTAKSKFTIVKDYAKTGIYSLKINNNRTNEAVSISGKRFPVNGDSLCNLSGQFYHISGTAPVIKLNFYDLSEKLITTETLKGTDENKWADCSIDIKVPDKAVEAEIIVENSYAKCVSYVDNIKLVSVSKPEEVGNDKLDNSSIVLFVGSANALVNGNKTLIDKENDKVIATVIDGRTLVPVRFIAENFGAEVVWDEETRTVTLALKDKTVKIALNKAKIDINGEIIPIDVPAQSIEGRTMLPLRAFVESVMGKKIFWDARGLIVITDTDILDSEADKERIDSLIETIK